MTPHTARCTVDWPSQLHMGRLTTGKRRIFLNLFLSLLPPALFLPRYIYISEVVEWTAALQCRVPLLSQTTLKMAVFNAARGFSGLR